MMWMLARDAVNRRRLIALNEHLRDQMLLRITQNSDTPAPHLDEASPLLPHRTLGRVRDVRLTWALKPHEAWRTATLTLEMTQSDGVAPPEGELMLWWREDTARTSEPDTPQWRCGDPNFDRHFDVHGDALRTLATLHAEVRQRLTALATPSHFDLKWLRLTRDQWRVRWHIPLKHLDRAALARTMAMAIEVGERLLTPDVSKWSTHLASWAEMPHGAAMERALTLLFDMAPHTPDATRAAHEMMRHEEEHVRLCAALHAPQLVEASQRSEALLWGMRHHHSATTRRACTEHMHAANPYHLQFHDILEDMALREEDTELRAMAQTLALRLHHTEIDAASILLAAQRLLKHDKTLLPVTRQRLEVAILRVSAKPNIATYRKLARTSADKILRYSSLRTLDAKCGDQRAALETICERAYHEPVSWIAQWCARTLRRRAQHGSAATLTAIARDEALPLSKRQQAALSDPVAHKRLLARWVGTNRLSTKDRATVLLALTRAGAAPIAETSTRKLLLKCQDRAEGILLNLAQHVELLWTLDLIETRMSRLSRSSRCTLLDTWLTQPLTALPRHDILRRDHVLERCALHMLQDHSDTVRRRAAQLLCERGTSKIVPALRRQLAYEEARALGLRTTLDVDRIATLQRIIRAIHARHDNAEGALTVISDDDDRGALTLAHHAGALRIADEEDAS